MVLARTEHLSWGTGRPTSVDRDGLPQPYSDLGFGLQFLDLLYGFSPDIYITSGNISYRYCLNILSTWVEQSNPGLSCFMNNTIISYESHLITTQFRSGFYIYILDRSFCLMLYNIAMIQHYSRCVIRQLL